MLVCPLPLSALTWHGPCVTCGSVLDFLFWPIRPLSLYYCVVLLGRALPRCSYSKCSQQLLHTFLILMRFGINLSNHGENPVGFLLRNALTVLSELTWLEHCVLPSGRPSPHLVKFSWRLSALESPRGWCPSWSVPVLAIESFCTLELALPDHLSRLG